MIAPPKNAQEYQQCVNAVFQAEEQTSGDTHPNNISRITTIAQFVHMDLAGQSPMLGHYHVANNIQTIQDTANAGVASQDSTNIQKNGSVAISC